MHLHVAEKPSVASQLAAVLSNGNFEYEANNKVYKLNEFVGPGRFSPSWVTSVQGHLFGVDYETKTSWSIESLPFLFDAPLKHEANAPSVSIVSRLKFLARSAVTLFIWTDCDREGENIGWEISKVILETRRVTVYRMRFSGLSQREVLRSFDRLSGLDDRIVRAVDARSEIDLRTGAIFTRFQSLKLRCFFADNPVLSYGTCQFPTTGFVIEQYRKVCDSASGSKWTVEISLKCGRQTFKLSWDRGYLHDRSICLCYHEMMRGQLLKLSDVQSSKVYKYKPVPLRTVELQKHVSTMFKMSAKDVMHTAEDLYHSGFISYPRTETDMYSSTFDFASILGSLREDEVLGSLAASVITNGVDAPRRGRNDDKAHPPIHPLKSGNGLSGVKKRIYEYVARRFIAGLMKNAEADQTRFLFAVSDEAFSIVGRNVVALNYLTAYTYEKWADLPIPSIALPFSTNKYDIYVREQSIAPPRLLNEAMLIATMDRNQIGTDATIHEIIDKVTQRCYVIKTATGYLPTRLGLFLCGFYDRFAPEYSLSKPELRKSMECSLQDICVGRTTKDQVLSHYIGKYRTLLDKVAPSFRELLLEIDQYRQA